VSACDYGNVYTEDSRLCDYAKYGQEAYELYSAKNLTPNCSRVEFVVSNVFQYQCATLGCTTYYREETLGFDEFNKRKCAAHEVGHQFYNKGKIWQYESFVEAMANVYTYNVMGRCSVYTYMWGSSKLYKVSPDKYAPDYSAGLAVYMFAGAYWSQIYNTDNWNLNPDEAYMNALMQLVTGVRVCNGEVKVDASDADYTLDSNNPSVTIQAESLRAYIILSKNGNVTIDNTTDCRVNSTTLPSTEVLAVVACYKDTKVTISVTGAVQPPQPPQPPTVTLKSEYVVNAYDTSMPTFSGVSVYNVLINVILPIARWTAFNSRSKEWCEGGDAYVLTYNGWIDVEDAVDSIGSGLFAFNKRKVTYLDVSEPIL